MQSGDRVVVHNVRNGKVCSYGIRNAVRRALEQVAWHKFFFTSQIALNRA